MVVYNIDNGKINFIHDGKCENEIEYSLSRIIIITYSKRTSELCEMRDEHIVWNELFVYDDIVNFFDYICIH